LESIEANEVNEEEQQRLLQLVDSMEESEFAKAANEGSWVTPISSTAISSVTEVPENTGKLK